MKTKIQKPIQKQTQTLGKSTMRDNLSFRKIHGLKLGLIIVGLVASPKQVAAASDLDDVDRDLDKNRSGMESKKVSDLEIRHLYCPGHPLTQVAPRHRYVHDNLQFCKGCIMRTEIVQKPADQTEQR